MCQKNKSVIKRSPVGRNMMIIVVAANDLDRELGCHECTNKHHESKITKSTAELGLLAAITVMVLGELLGSNPAKAPSPSEGNQAVAKTNPLKPPAKAAYLLRFLFRKAHK